jgi:hypothetical protein
MKHAVRYGTTVIGVAAALTSAAAAFAIGPQTSPYLGDPGDASIADRTITITPATKWVNVTRGETVKFVDASSRQSFVWNFDTPTWATIDLAEVAPAGLGGRHVLAYVQNDPEDNSGD